MNTEQVVFSDLGLSEPLLRALNDVGYTHPTPIQAKAIPVVLTGRDLLAAAQTGTGKTAGFTLPILQRLTSAPAPKRVAGKPRCLILTPTRELTAQVAESVTDYAKYTRIRSVVIFGGVSINPQIQALRQPVDILVATPGRLLDHVQQGTVDLSGIEIFVLDEADRMLDMGFIHDIKRVIAKLPAKRQNLLFSATFSPDIRSLAHGLLDNPAEVDVAPRNTASELVEQHVYLVPKARKRALLSFLIGSQRWTQVLVFTRTKHGANRLAEQLGKDGIEAMAIHGNKSQGARTRALSQFKDGSLPVLVATDIAARGLDIDELPHVVNFELPNVSEDYVHRIGRTGRAGREGAAISLVDREEMKLLTGIERLIKRQIPRKEVEGFTGWQAQPGDADHTEDINHWPEPAPGQRRGQGRRNGARGDGARGDGARTGGRRDGAARSTGAARGHSGSPGSGASRAPGAGRSPGQNARRADGAAGSEGNGRRHAGSGGSLDPRGAPRRGLRRPHGVERAALVSPGRSNNGNDD
ncbi:MAG: DEAD/DEAH box helicase [Lautropia sp.]|nr:DEAD/DEAH box helicase [Lautropia sp.]